MSTAASWSLLLAFAGGVAVAGWMRGRRARLDITWKGRGRRGRWGP